MVLGSVALIDGPTAGAGAGVRVGSVPVLPASTRLLGAIEPGQIVYFDIVLKSKDPSALAALAASGPTRSGALGPAAFAQRFGAARSTIVTVERVLAAAGVTTDAVTADRLLIHAHARSRVVERAFALRIDRYRLASGKIAYANAEAPMLPRAVAASVASILGLDSLAAAMPAGLVRAAAGVSHGRVLVRRAALVPRTAGPTPTGSCGPTPSAVSSAGFTADQIAGAYGFDNAYGLGNFGAGTAVAIVEFAPFDAGDVAAYEACYGLTATSTPPAPAITSTAVDVSSISQTGTDPGGEAEATIDVETVAGLAPGAALHVYEAPNNGSSKTAVDVYATAVNDPSVSVITTSWGQCEAIEGADAANAESVIFQEAAVEGKTVVAAAGDQGSEDCFGMKLGSAGRALAVDDPASQWYVTGVGGTTLGSIAPPSESAWRDGGGGVSTLWSMPSYQSGTSPALGVVGPSASCPTASGNCREVPDVSANAGAAESFFCGGGAEPCSPSGWAGYGGTSLSAPTWAALFALANASAACSGARVGFANPSLYAVAAGPGYTQAFNDITAGENDALGAHGGQYSASAGYDLATGLGTPIAGSGAVGDPGLIGQLCQAARPSSFPRAVAAGVGTSEPGLLLPPRITKLLPTSGTVRGGTQVTIRGARFTHVRSVMFGTRRAKSFRVLSASSIVAVDPGAQAGLVRVEVTTATGTTSRAVAARFTYAAMPVVSSVAPASGSSRGGSVATISGSSLTGVTSVRFGAVAAAMVRTSAVRVTVVVPAGRGTVDVTVTTPGGTSRTGPFDRFRYVS